MTNYYITDDNTENGKILEWIRENPNPHWGENYFTTEKNIVLVTGTPETGDSFMLQDDYDNYIQTPEYIQAQKTSQKIAIGQKYKDLFDELDSFYPGQIMLGFFELSDYESDRADLVQGLTQEMQEVNNG